MSEIFINIVNMSISSSYIVLAVLLLRFLIKKAPKWLYVVLWGIVGVRLVCPFTFESVMSLIPSAETISPNIMTDWTPEVNTGIPIVNQVINPVIGSSFTPDPATSANPLQLWIPTFALFWLIGIAALIIYTDISYINLKRKIGTAVILKDNIYQSDNVVSPFVLGLFRPKIYLPFNISDRDMIHVTAHEKAHIRRKDHLWKPLGFLILTVHWFNPLVWLGYILLCRDIELACDEKVIKELDRDSRADYSQALLTCSVNRKMIAACPLAFGEVGVKDRVRSVLSYKKPAFWIIVLSIIVCIFTALSFLTDPKTLDSIGAHTFDPIELVYGDGMYSSIMRVEYAPDYLIVNDMCLLERRDGVVSDGIGKFAEITLTEETFDSRFRGTTYGWLEKDTLESLKKNNKRIWQFYHESSKGNLELYVLLEQKNGTFYLGYGYYNCNSVSPANPDDSHIRWLYKLKEISGSNDLSLENSTVSTALDLKEKYPYFFDLDASDGLTVYMWQLAPEHYRCYLGSTAMDRISDMSFAFTGGASIKEMRAILSMYDISKDNVTLKPVINPISSMHYVIDDEYRENINKLFWSEEYTPSGNIGETSALSYAIEEAQKKIAELEAIANESNEYIKQLEAAIENEKDRGTSSNSELLNQLTTRLTLEKEAADQIYKRLDTKKESLEKLKDQFEYAREETYTNIVFHYEGEHTFLNPKYYKTYRNQNDNTESGYRYYHIAFIICHDCGEVFESDPFYCCYNSLSCKGGCVEQFRITTNK